MKSIKHSLLTFALLGGLLARGATNIVTTTADSGTGSLRSFIASSAIVGDTIIFHPVLSGQTILLTSGQLFLNKSLTIDGSGLLNGIAINGNNSSRIFQVIDGHTVVLTCLTITNGRALGNGGGIHNGVGATLTVNQCSFLGNLATNSGGGIYNAGNLIVNKSTLSGNSANGTSSGGILNIGTLSVNQSTLSGNSAANYGGGVFNTGNMTVNLSTLSGNSAGIIAGGIYNFGTLNLTNSIVAENSDGGGSPNIYGSFSDSNNITNGNPLLAPLGNYGGTTMTMPPLPGSPAIDGCTNVASFTTDQRGQPRVVGAFADIGAVEGVFNPSFALVDPVGLGNGDFQFSFANLAGASFTVFASTNVALPFNAWSNLGAAVETPARSGQYQFTDPQATNYTERFYRVSSP